MNKLRFNYLSDLHQVQQQAPFLKHMYIFFNLGYWKTFDYGGPAWLSPGVLLLKFPIGDAASLLVLSLEEFRGQEAIPLCGGGRGDRLQLTVFTSKWQDWLNHDAGCVLGKQLEFLRVKD